MLLEAIAGHQTIITTTHLDDILPVREHKGIGRKLSIVQGKVEKF